MCFCDIYPAVNFGNNPIICKIYWSKMYDYKEPQHIKLAISNLCDICYTDAKLLKKCILKSTLKSVSDILNA